MLKRTLLVTTIMTTALAVVPTVVSADTITGGLKVFPYAYWQYPDETLTSLQGQTLSTQATGQIASFLATLPAVTVNLQNYGSTIPLDWLGTNSNLSCGSNCLFSLTVPGDGFGWLNVTELHEIGEFFWGTPTYGWTGTGILTLNGSGFDPTPGKFDMFVQWGDFGWTDTWMSIDWIDDPPSSVPGPIVGSGLAPWLLGLIGWHWYRKRRKVE
jgi:hypothetical protein